jgi:hypothetical protein
MLSLRERSQMKLTKYCYRQACYLFDHIKFISQKARATVQRHKGECMVLEVGYQWMRMVNYYAAISKARPITKNYHFSRYAYVLTDLSYRITFSTNIFCTG